MYLVTIQLWYQWIDTLFVVQFIPMFNVQFKMGKSYIVLKNKHTFIVYIYLQKFTKVQIFSTHTTVLRTYSN